MVLCPHLASRRVGDAGSVGSHVRIKMVCLEDGITSCGFRKMAAYADRLNPDTQSYYVSTKHFRGVGNFLSGASGMKGELGDADIDELAHGLAGADVVGFLVDDRVRRADPVGDQAAPRHLAVDLPHLGRHPPDHPPRGRDPRRRRRHLQRRGRDGLPPVLRRLLRGPGPHQDRQLLVPPNRRRDPPQRLPAADDVRGDGDAAVPPVRGARRDDLRPGPGLRPRHQGRLRHELQPRLPDGVVDRVPVPLLVLRQHQVHRQRCQLQEDPPPQRPVCDRRGQGGPGDVPPHQQRQLQRRQLHGHPLPGARGSSPSCGRSSWPCPSPSTA